MAGLGASVAGARIAGVERDGDTGERLERGSDLSRLTAFSDGVFAIAITLLVLQIDVPSGVGSSSELWDGLRDESGNLFAFALSFAVIGAFWVTHHRFMRRLQAFDTGLMWRNLLYLAFLVLIPFFSQLIGEYGDEASLAVILYAANLALIAAASIMMISHGLAAGLIQERYRDDARTARLSLAYTGAIFLASIPLAIPLGGIAPFIWLAAAFNPFERLRARG